jgi:hypothetical protein
VELHDWQGCTTDNSHEGHYYASSCSGSSTDTPAAASSDAPPSDSPGRTTTPIAEAPKFETLMVVDFLALSCRTAVAASPKDAAAATALAASAAATAISGGTWVLVELPSEAGPPLVAEPDCTACTAGVGDPAAARSGPLMAGDTGPVLVLGPAPSPLAPAVGEVGPL